MKGSSPCIAWVPLLRGQLLDLFKKKNKKKTVDSPHLDLRAIGDPPPPDLQAVDDPFPDFPAVDDPLPYLPHHIVTEILSRIPAKYVFQSQSLCRPLNVLTTTPFFIHTHLNRATSVVVVHSFTQSRAGDFKLYFFDEKAEKIEATSMKFDLRYGHEYDPIILYGSYGGFLLFRTVYVRIPAFLMWNPVTKEQVTITSPDSLYVCGFYFHAVKRDYEVLFVCKKQDGSPEFEFQILSLGTKSFRNVGNCSYPPCCQRPPIIIDGSLYWMVDQRLYYDTNHVYPSRSHWIVSFKIETEEFSTIECCGRSSRKRGFYSVMMHLFEMDGQLCLCDPLSFTDVDLWVLNSTIKCWVNKYSPTLPKDDHAWRPSPNRFFVEAVQYFKKGELLVRQWHRLVLYNLHLGTCRVVEKKGFEGDSYTATTHTPSLLSLHTDSLISVRRK